MLNDFFWRANSPQHLYAEGPLTPQPGGIVFT